MRALFVAFLGLVAFSAAVNAGVVARWVQLGPGGVADARAVISAEAGHAAQCPDVTTGGVRHAMTARSAAIDSFALVCDFELPPKSEGASIGGERFPTPTAAPRRIVVLGDTGCRIKPPAVQDCNNAAAWPFAQIAQSAANLKPDLVIHVGDFVYRESACPTGNAGCAGTPWGDNWNTWAADFFTPAAPLLAAAPWVIVRGNHEVCARAGNGFLRLLGPVAFDANAACADHLAPYSVPAGAMNLVVFDDSSAPDTSLAEPLMPSFKADFAGLATIAPSPQWLVMHRPIWGLIRGPLGVPAGGNLTMITAAGDLRALQSVALLLSGHIHTFEAINYTAHVPPQILAGHGGDNLDPTPADLRGAVFQGLSGVAVKDGLSVGGFGFLLVTQAASGWTIDLERADGSTVGSCLFLGGRVDCGGLRPAPAASQSPTH